jgi:aspartate/methionine/tyrosine aminotransferase
MKALDMKKIIADRIRVVQPFLGRVMNERARALEAKGEKLIHFELGEPDFDTPANIREAAKKALDEGITRYTANAGLIELRRAIAEKLKKDNSIDVDPASHICVTVGSQEAAFLAIMCTIEPGDEVLIPEPGYYTYRNCVQMAGGTPVSVPLKEENDFRLGPKDFEEKMTSRSKMVVINSPCNPTGSVMTKDDLAAIDELATKHDFLMLSDEIYEKIIYDNEKHYSIAALSKQPDKVITVNGFSKAYAMTGWRIGYLIASKEIIAESVKLQQSAVASATSFAQRGATEALKGPQETVRKMAEEFARRRDVIIDGLNRIKDFSVVKPKGAFYAFANIKKLKKPSQELAEYLLSEAKVVTTPGAAFGEAGEGYLRISYATSIENIKHGLENIKRAVGKL